MINKTMSVRIVLTICIAAVLFSCNNNRGSKKASSESDSATMAVTKTSTPASSMPSLPFNVVVVKHIVADYNTWKPFFDADSTYRSAAGMHSMGVARGLENQNDVEAPFMIDDLGKAKAFVSDPRLKDVMQKAGVTSTPEIKFLKVIRMSEQIQQPGEFAEVKHNVKNFTEWLKIYDGEGVAKRAGDGLEDGVLARGIDDSNMVVLVFRINDLEKAKAAMNDPARQKLMHDAGVIGKPEIYFGRDQQ